MPSASLYQTFLSFSLFLKYDSSPRGLQAGPSLPLQPPQPPLTLTSASLNQPHWFLSPTPTMSSPVTRAQPMWILLPGTHCPPYSALVCSHVSLCAPFLKEHPTLSLRSNSPHYKLSQGHMLPLVTFSVVVISLQAVYLLYHYLIQHPPHFYPRPFAPALPSAWNDLPPHISMAGPLASS